MSASVLLSLDVMEGATLTSFCFLFIKFESTFQIIKKKVLLKTAIRVGHNYYCSTIQTVFLKSCNIKKPKTERREKGSSNYAFSIFEKIQFNHIVFIIF